MIYEIVFLSKAKQEFLDAWKWYEDCQPDLGEKFKMQVYSCITKLEKQPELFPVRKEDYREAPVKIFPYLIIYRVRSKKKQIAIVSVFHMRRNPKKKYKQ